MAAPTTAEIQAAPDRILELYPDGCPQCKSPHGLEALTWQSRGLPDVTVGCNACGYMVFPAGVTVPPKCPNCGVHLCEGCQVYACEVCNRDCCTACTDTTEKHAVICDHCNPSSSCEP